MNTILLDSDVLIEITRGRDEHLCERWKGLSLSDVVISCSPVTVAEVWHGARPHEQPLISKLFDSIECIPIDSAIGCLAGDYLRGFARIHQVELGDALIAATVSIHKLALWTRNRKHYPMPALTFFGDD